MVIWRIRQTFKRIILGHIFYYKICDLVAEPKNRVVLQRVAFVYRGAEGFGRVHLS